MYKTQILYLVVVCFGSLQINKAFELPRAQPKITVLDTQRSSLGEGPYYNGNTQTLHYVDSIGGDVIRLDLSTMTESKIHVGGTASIIIPFSDDGNNFLVTSDSQLLKLNWDTSVTEVVAAVTSDRGNEKLNDGKCDARGRLIIGTVTTNLIGGVVANASSVYKLTPENELVKLVEGISVSNGMSWSGDGKTFYLNDLGKRIIYAFDYDAENGALSNQRVLIDMHDHPDFVATEYPDGMTADRFGYIWVCMYGGGRIVKINPDTARVVDEIRVPRANSPTSMAWGEYNGEYGFFVTTGLNLLDGGKIHHVSFLGGEIKAYSPNS